MTGHTPFEVWNEDLNAICGSYFGVPKSGQNTVSGRITVKSFDTLDVADISGNIDKIVRNRRGIRQDDAEHIFLVMEMDGQLGVDHNGHCAILAQGDCILLDSTKEGTLANLDTHRRILSFHLPRQSFLNERGVVPRIGERLSSNSDAARTLGRHLSRVLRPEGRPGRATTLFDLVHHAFSRPDAGLASAVVSDTTTRFDLAVDLIDLNLSWDGLKLPWLAKQLGLSTRQAQRLFEEQGTSFREMVRSKRYRFVREQLDRVDGAHGRIADIAFQAGFRDLSNFNRGFRHRMGMTPREYHAQSVAGMAQKSKIRAGLQR